VIAPTEVGRGEGAATTGTASLTTPGAIPGAGIGSAPGVRTPAHAVRHSPVATASIACATALPGARPDRAADDVVLRAGDINADNTGDRDVAECPHRCRRDRAPHAHAPQEVPVREKD
jgi:hypothetical protein